MDSTATRRQWRRELVDKFLAENGLTYDVLAQSTQKNLDEWARQVRLVTDQPSANWDNAVLQLCKAVESELASTLGRAKGLEFLASEDALGNKAHRLEKFVWQSATTQRLSLPGSKLTFVPSTLPTLLLRLARLRRDSAHGRVRTGSATAKEGRQARTLAATIFKQIIMTNKQ
jgi:hypothetical protein